MFVQFLASAAIVLASAAGGCDANGGIGAPAGDPATAGEQTVTMMITGYAKIDNSPAGSTAISMPVIHHQAGGTGTFDDPLTAASPGHAGSTEFPAGTKFYVAEIHRYVIIEDSGATKYNLPHLDIWNGTADNALTCEDKITGKFPVIENPAPGHPVTAGPIATGTGCNI